MTWTWISEHWATIAVTAGLLLSPAVTTMPNKIPSSIQDWWTWFYDYSHQLSNSRNTRLSTEPIPTAPTPTAVPK